MIDRRKLALYFVLKHTPSFTNFFAPGAYRRYCRVRYYQEPYFLSEGAACQGGRRYGKTFGAVWKSIQGVFKYPRKEQLLATFRRAHLQNVFEEIVSIVLNTEFFKEYLLYGRELKSVSRDILHSIKFKNGHTYYAIAVGDDPHATQIKGRSPRIRHTDEAQDFPQSAANILSSTMDPEGVEEYFYGVVDGRRDTFFYNILEKSTLFKKKVFKFSRRYDPNFCQEDLVRASEQIEGGELGDKFGQEVDAEHGSPAAAVWNIEDLIECTANYDFSDTNPRILQDIILTPKDYRRGDEIAPLFRTMFRATGDVVLGIDVGEAQPTMVLPFIKENDYWVLKNKIELRDHMDTVDQADIIYYIINQFHVLGIGIDVTSSPAIADILESKDEKLKDSITRVRFNTNIVYGFEKIETEEQIARYLQEEGKRVKMGEIVEKKQKTKNYSTEKARRMLAERRVLFYYHRDTIENFVSEEARKTQSGVVIETPRTVHFPEAFRCFVMAYLDRFEQVREPVDEYETVFPEQCNVRFFGREKSSGMTGIEFGEIIRKKIT